MVILALGGNLGAVEETFRTAVSALSAGGVQVQRVSTPYRNPAVGCEEGAPDFLNVVLCGQWSGTPLALLELCQSIEEECGRPAEHPHWRSRTLDIDIIACNGVHCSSERLTLPHPRWNQRGFVLVPLRELFGASADLNAVVGGTAGEPA